MSWLKYKPWFRIIISLYVFLRAIFSFYLLLLLRRLRLITKEGFKKRVKSSNKKNAQRILKAILWLEGLFVKLGQFISTRFDILPREYTEALSTLQDEVPPKSLNEIKRVLEEELKSPVHEIFLEFDSSPIASASLAQVHRACLRDSRIVAVKIQYPGIERIVRADLRALKIIFSILSYLQRPVNYRPVYEEMEKYIWWELDFVNEGKNAETIKQNFSDDPSVVIPSVIWEYTTKRVLTLSFIEGYKITDVDGVRKCGFTPQEVMNKVVDIYFRQILQHGFFQADPHPGNIFVMEGKKIALLDFGLSKKLNPGLLTGLLQLVQGIASKNVDMVYLSFSQMGFTTLDKKEESLKNFADFVVRYGRKIVTKNPKKINYQALIQEIAEMGRKNPLVRIPTDFVLLGRVFGHLMGIGRYFKVKVDFQNILLPYFSR